MYLIKKVKLMENLLNLSEDEYFMKLAIKQSYIAYNKGEVPVGAISVYNNEIIAKAYNQVELLKDATAHAEMLVLTQTANAIGDWRLNNIKLYVTKEPCAMCAGAMVNSRVGNLIYGIYDKNYGAAGSVFNITDCEGALHKINTQGGILERDCLEIFKSFFKDLRKK